MHGLQCFWAQTIPDLLQGPGKMLVGLNSPSCGHRDGQSPRRGRPWADLAPGGSALPRCQIGWAPLWSRGLSRISTPALQFLQHLFHILLDPLIHHFWIVIVVKSGVEGDAAHPPGCPDLGQLG